MSLFHYNYFLHSKTISSRTYHQNEYLEIESFCFLTFGFHYLYDLLKAKSIALQHSLLFDFELAFAISEKNSLWHDLPPSLILWLCCRSLAIYQWKEIKHNKNDELHQLRLGCFVSLTHHQH